MRQSEVEKIVAESWARVLKLEQLPAADAMFFDQGGTSLGALELLAEVEERLGVMVELDSLFIYGDLASFVAACLQAIERRGS